MTTALDRHITGNYGEDQFVEESLPSSMMVMAFWPEALGFLPIHADGVPGCEYAGWAVHGDYTLYADDHSRFEADCPSCGYRMTGRKL